MFSVDNFYDYFNSCYGFEKTNNLVKVFNPHGSKYLHNLEPFGLLRDTVYQIQNGAKHGSIVMHDQEPLFLDHLDTYRSILLHQKNSLYCVNEKQQGKIEGLAKFDTQAANIDFFLDAVNDTNILPIVCHSELNSDDISALNAQGIPTCYYWWHGMVARDWFRHWHHHQDLLPTNKSACTQRFLLYSRSMDGTRHYRKSLVAFCEQLKHTVRYNWNDQPVSADHSAKITRDDAVAPLHIVAETLFDTNKVHLTEKVFKPMVMSQAFLLFAPPGSLAYLRSYGFKTFDHCWDESYDLVPNAQHRMQMLLNLISDLATMTAEEFDSMYQRALPQIQHNRMRFFELAFQDEIILEMHRNMNQCLFEQNQSH